ncbi:MAG: class I SAM-dependent methyltransferase [Verrucomicrobia bacterium]|nr:class I SAM-dependent methyltransferase [Verrucomicrobiota bacterium]
MKSKAEIIRDNLKGLQVLDIGGSGYGEDNPYESELRKAWSVCKQRITVDCSSSADISMDLNALPLPTLGDIYDVATAFDVLEHLDHPVDVLKWIPSFRLIVILPNALSWIARRMEVRNKSKHLYSFTPYTASILLHDGGWRITRMEYQFGKWSLAARTINAIGSLYPQAVATGLVFHCNKV